MTDAQIIEEAISIAVYAHRGQVDKQQMPYILHPLRVMARVQKAVGLSVPHIVTAVLHDVVEDTNVTMEDLRACGFSQEILDALDSVTKREGENYISFVRRSNQNPIGRIVKIADVEDNHERIPTKINSKWWNRLSTKYVIALAILNNNSKWLENNAELVAGFEAA